MSCDVWRLIFLFVLTGGSHLSVSGEVQSAVVSCAEAHEEDQAEVISRRTGSLSAVNLSVCLSFFLFFVCVDCVCVDQLLSAESFRCSR